MITISVCMIVKNESQILERCLESLKGIWDELVIVDTGSDDNTREIALGYTDKVYDFVWNGDFSKARNFALDKATCDYIYTADADEILEGDNVRKFLALKSCLDPAVDVVQMYYGNQLDNGTVYNFDKELRPKLFKRVKPIRFIEPIHETLNVEPVIYDSDIVITHKPTSQHAPRDLAAFKKIIAEKNNLSRRLFSFLARELYMLGTREDYEDFADYLYHVAINPESDDESIAEACTLLARHHRLGGDYISMFDNVVKVVAMESNSEICVELGAYYFDQKRYDDAAIWYYNAFHECTPILSIHAGHDIALNGLADVYHALGNYELETEYRNLASAPIPGTDE